jgi:hypothetical protein
MDEILTSKNKLLLRKMGVAFIVGFLGVFLPAALQVLDALQSGTEQPDNWNVFWISLISGAVAAGVRAVLALSPISLTQTDKLNSLKNPAQSVTIETAAPPAPASPDVRAGRPGS